MLSSPSNVILIHLILAAGFLQCFTLGQLFSGGGNLTTAPQVEAPEGLSEACSATYQKSLACDIALKSVSNGDLLPTDLILQHICVDDCLAALEALREDQSNSCSTDTLYIDDAERSPVYLTDVLIFTYNYTCLRDPTTSSFCFPQFDSFNSGDSALSQSEVCSACNLMTFYTQLSSYLGWDEELEESFASLTESCGVSTYTIPASARSSDSTSSDETDPTATWTAPEKTCVSKYTIQEGDDCHSISKSQKVSTFYLMDANDLELYCSNFPGPGVEICIPPRCDVYTVQEKDTCSTVTRRLNYTTSTTQLISWNPTINRACSNLDIMAGHEICVSFPGGIEDVDSRPTAIATTAPVPSNVAPDTMTDCSEYFTVKTGDTCSTISEVNGISLYDFFFLNPAVSNPACDNLLLGSSYCVSPVGDIRTYPYYGKFAARHPCFRRPPPASCTPTTYPTDTYWEWPTQFASTTVSLATPTMPVTPNDFPLAPGTLDNCFTYEMYREPLWERVSAKRYNSCGTISSFYGLEIETLIEWNPSLTWDENDFYACSLAKGYKYCVRRDKITPRPRASSSTATSSTTTLTSSSSAGSAVEEPTPSGTPGPIQPGVEVNCNEFYLVVDGDGCYAIAETHGIELEDFYRWNPAVGDDCAALLRGFYVCVGVSSE